MDLPNLQVSTKPGQLQGNSTVTDASFTIGIRNTSGALVQELSFVRTILAGETIAADQQLSTAGLAAGDYTATLAVLGNPARTLDTRSFTLVESDVSIDLRTAALSRVLLWADCRSGNASKPCTPVAPQRITTALRSAGVPYTLVGTETEFLQAVRSGAYSEALLYQLGSAEVKNSLEYLASIRSGFGLVYIGNRTSANPKLDPALAVGFRGKLQGPVTIELMDGPFADAGTIVMQGDGVAIDLAGAHAAGLVMATQAPAITWSAYGEGRAVVIPFDTELTAAADSLVMRAVRFVAKAPADVIVASQVIPVEVLVSNSSPSPVTISVTASITGGASVVDASPALSSLNPIVWNLTVPGDTTRPLGLWLRMPNQTGTVRVTITVSGAGTPVTTSIDLDVAEDAASLASDLRLTLESMLSSAPAGEATVLSDARDGVVWISSLTNPDASTIGLVVQRLLTIQSTMANLSTDTSIALAKTDRLLAYWETRLGN